MTPKLQVPLPLRALLTSANILVNIGINDRENLRKELGNVCFGCSIINKMNYDFSGHRLGFMLTTAPNESDSN